MAAEMYSVSLTLRTFSAHKILSTKCIFFCTNCICAGNNITIVQKSQILSMIVLYKICKIIMCTKLQFVHDIYKTLLKNQVTVRHKALVKFNNFKKKKKKKKNIFFSVITWNSSGTLL